MALEHNVVPGMKDAKRSKAADFEIDYVLREKATCMCTCISRSIAVNCAVVGAI
jgi:hypothetical protein